MNHRKLKHINTVAQCKKVTLGICKFTSDMCWWRHETNQTDQNLSFNCHTCREGFKSRHEMMIHRKTMHREKVRKCTNFITNSCPYLSSSCWFLHENNDEAEVSENEEKDGKNSEKSVFQKVTENLKPPIIKQKKDQ